MATQYTAGLSVGQVLTAATMNSIGAAWESYTPTLTQNGARTKTIQYAKYTQINKLVVGEIVLTVTQTGTAGNFIIVSIPITAAQTTQDMAVGSFIYNRAVGTRYAGTCVMQISVWGGIFFQVPGATILGFDPSFAIANGDYLSLNFQYEAA